MDNEKNEAEPSGASGGSLAYFLAFPSVRHKGSRAFHRETRIFGFFLDWGLPSVRRYVYLWHDGQRHQHERDNDERGLLESVSPRR